MSQQLDRRRLESILQSGNIESQSFPELIRLFQREKELSQLAPDGICQIDPRNGERILFNSARARRPKDFPAPVPPPEPPPARLCPACLGKTTGVLDVCDLSEGFTFINKNLFPMIYPVGMGGAQVAEPRGLNAAGSRAYGFHFLQWTSSFHDRDWQNLPASDCLTVMERLGALEKKLLKESEASMPSQALWEGPGDCHGFVSIIKNYGAQVGGSLQHGHQQIAHSNVMPRAFQNNLAFFQEQREPFSAYLFRENPSELLVRDYPHAQLIVPYFMRRPYNMMLLLKSTAKRFLHELDRSQLADVAQGWQDGARLMLQAMNNRGLSPAYSIVTHNGPAPGLYWEFLPFTQPTGGFEQLGISVCQGNPPESAAELREILS